MSWVYSLIWTLPPLFGWSRYGPEGPGTTCSVDWTTKTANNISYIICLFIFCLIVPFLVIVFCYGKLLHAIKQVSETLSTVIGYVKSVFQLKILHVPLVVLYLIKVRISDIQQLLIVHSLQGASWGYFPCSRAQCWQGISKTLQFQLPASISKGKVDLKRKVVLFFIHPSCCFKHVYLVHISFRIQAPKPKK